MIPALYSVLCDTLYPVIGVSPSMIMFRSLYWKFT